MKPKNGNQQSAKSRSLIPGKKAYMENCAAFIELLFIMAFMVITCLLVLMAKYMKLKTEQLIKGKMNASFHNVKRYYQTTERS